MKKLFTTSVLALSSLTAAFAQTEPGSVLVGSSISQLAYSTSSGGDQNTFSAALTPTAGIFVAKRLAVGAEILLGYATSNNDYRIGSAKLKEFTYGLAPFARYYVLDAPKHKVFGQASYGLIGYSATYETDFGGSPQRSKDSYWSPRVGLGYNYFITPMVALEAQPYYRYTPTQVVSDTRANQWGLSVGLQIFFPKTAGAAQ
ncbi:porin family protein [Hymenobacter sp. BT635]|uniref:Porin family protein n=1 Tax=Hymenobacter nitidus TaxID=2880929 RepID=A0ABS8AE40_9BACT|nr:outer membrane beta-barrel protein [Hymenobacter nitidus]MCB2378675.1 porin family protein [Hymenobacter nitidus]